MRQAQTVIRGELMVDKNLFFYDLAVAAIFKDEARYLQEWLDYHLLAGVEHFYLYNNDSSDDYAEVLAPYVAANLVTLTDWPGKLQMYPAYEDVLERHRFDCRYIAFIDLDEFLYPKTGQSIVEVVDEILSRDPNAAALGVNWQCFGSNGLETADYSCGVLERFTRRAPRDWLKILSDKSTAGNVTIKSIVNPRRVDCWWSPHYASYFRDFYSINTNGAKTLFVSSHPVAADKLVVNHYFTKSREEYMRKKMPKGSVAVKENYYNAEMFDTYDRNEEFDDGILKYHASRADCFALESDADRIRRVERALVDTLTQCSPFDAPADFFVDKMETFLTCRAVAERLGTKIGSRTAEEYALVWLYQMLCTGGVLTYADLQLFVNALPEILARPFPLGRKVVEVFAINALPAMLDAAKDFNTWKVFKNLQLLQRLLRTI